MLPTSLFSLVSQFATSKTRRTVLMVGLLALILVLVVAPQFAAYSCPSIGSCPCPGC